MGWFQRTFLNNPEARMERAEIHLQRREFNHARLELEGLDEPLAMQKLEEARKGLASLNLEEAQARFSSGDDVGALEHLNLAHEFGADQNDIRRVKELGRSFQQQRRQEAIEKQKARDKSHKIKGNDPIWSLPPEDPRLQYALRLEEYPVELREKLIPLGQEFAQAVLSIDSNPQEALQVMNNFVEQEPAVRYERALAALACGEYPLAISDLMTFGQEVGHQEIGTVHTGALLGQLMAQLGRQTEGLKTMEELLKDDNHPSMRIVRSQLLFHNGQYKIAEQETQKLLKEYPKSQPLIRQLAEIRIKLENRISAANVLEAGFASCCATGTCGSQPPDIASMRLLARIYLEDRAVPERSDELLQQLSHMVKQPTWEDQYLITLKSRNDGNPVAQELAVKLFQMLKDGDPRQKWITEAFDLPA